MTYAPIWYQNMRSAILLLETIIGLFALSFPLHRKPWFLLRLGLSTAAGMMFLGLFASKIYIVGYLAGGIGFPCSCFHAGLCIPAGDDPDVL